MSSSLGACVGRRCEATPHDPNLVQAEYAEVCNDQSDDRSLMLPRHHIKLCLTMLTGPKKQETCPCRVGVRLLAPSIPSLFIETELTSTQHCSCYWLHSCLWEWDWCMGWDGKGACASGSDFLHALLWACSQAASPRYVLKVVTFASVGKMHEWHSCGTGADTLHPIFSDLMSSVAVWLWLPCFASCIMLAVPSRNVACS